MYNNGLFTCRLYFIYRAKQTHLALDLFLLSFFYFLASIFLSIQAKILEMKKLFTLS